MTLPPAMTHARIRFRTRLGRILATALSLLTLAAVVALGAGALGSTAAAAGPLNKTLRLQKVDRVIHTASRLKGTPYVYGGTTRRGFDCSGYTRFVYAKAGEKLPRTSRQQFASAHKVAKNKVRRGDLVFFHRGGRVYHVGIYAGDKQIWHAPRPGQKVKLEKIWTSAWRAGRVL